MILIRNLMTALALATLCACGESASGTHAGLSAMGKNYTHRNIERIVVTDFHGNRASFSDVLPGGGHAGLACCYKLKGREMAVEWEYSHNTLEEYDRRVPHEKRRVTANLEIGKRESDAGGPILFIHVFPDEHVELEIGYKQFAPGRIEMFDTAATLWERYPAIEKKYGADGFYDFMRANARVIGEAWRKYGLTSRLDLESFTDRQYAYNDRFDEHPAIRAALERTRGKRDEFAKEMANTPDAVWNELKAQQSSRDKAATAGAPPGKKP